MNKLIPFDSEEAIRALTPEGHAKIQQHLAKFLNSTHIEAKQFPDCDLAIWPGTDHPEKEGMMPNLPMLWAHKEHVSKPIQASEIFTTNNQSYSIVISDMGANTGYHSGCVLVPMEKGYYGNSVVKKAPRFL